MHPAPAHLTPGRQRRFDFPTNWTSLLAELTAAAAWQGPAGATRNCRALSCLKHSVRGLRNKRIVVEAARGAQTCEDTSLLPDSGPEVPTRLPASLLCRARFMAAKQWR